MALRVKAGVQINIAITPVEGVEEAKGLRKMIFPLMYFMDESQGLTDPESIQRLKKMIADAKTG